MIVTKIDMIDYVGDTTQHAKTWNNRPTRGNPASRWTITLSWFSGFQFFV